MDDFNPENKVLHMYNSKIRDGRRKLNCQFEDKQITPGPPYFNVARDKTCCELRSALGSIIFRRTWRSAETRAPTQH